MADPGDRRVDRGSRLIRAAPGSIYQAFLNPDSIAAWRPPEGMTARIHAFEPVEGGAYRMTFVYLDSPEAQGKTSAHEDVFHGRFVTLVPDALIVEEVTFESDDPSFAGIMTITTRLDAVPGGTEVSVACEDVPPGISPADHAAGIASSLEKLAAFVE